MAALYLAMWSGPRNLSTALMRSFGSRPDAFVCDEPLYAHYLKVTGRPHPGADEVIADQDNDWESVANWLTGPIPNGRSVFYQKHMAHHLLDRVGRDWLTGLTHAFLIRNPTDMLTSLLKVFPEAVLLDTGLPQQVAIFDEIGGPVIDSRDLAEHPEPILRQLCERIGLDFQPSMLEWPPGPRDTDGIWSRHWYARVEDTTGFVPFRDHDRVVPDDKQDVYEACLPLYEHLYSHRLKP